MPVWDPDTYLRHADERGRPFAELLARVDADAPRLVVDLGCGPGGLTATLAERWPDAEVVGVDSSPAMVERAAEHASARVRFELADLVAWTPPGPVDVLVSNATLQWVPGHRDLLGRLVGLLTPAASGRRGGVLAFQVPGNFGEPSHTLLRSLAAEPPYAAATAAVVHPASAEPVDYLSTLTGLGCVADVWETTYLHVLSGPDPVFGWISGTGARPVLQALHGDARAAFEAEYRRRLDAAYPAQPFGTVLPFRRIFAVARLAEVASGLGGAASGPGGAAR